MKFLEQRLARILVSCIVAMGVASVPLAEVSTDRATNDRRNTIQMVRITDGIDPVPHVVWQPYRPLAAQDILNPSGVVRPDGPPDVAWHPVTGAPVVVWAYNNGTDHDIAASVWTANGWSAVEFLTSSVEDERDPRVTVARNGTIHVVWWVDSEDPHVKLLSRPPGTDLWNSPVRVTAVAETGRQPTVAISGDEVFVAYDHPSAVDATSVRQITVRRRLDNGAFTVDHVVGTQRNEDSRPMLHERDGRVWLDWRMSTTQYGYAELGDSWSDVGLMDWSGETWVDDESARKAVMLQLLLYGAPASNQPLDP